MSQVYSAGDVVGKTLTVNSDQSVYDLPQGTVIGTVKAGNAAGVVYSYLQESDGSLWWQFDSANSNMPANSVQQYYLLNAPGAFNVSDLQQQGLLTLTEKAALANPPDLVSRIAGMLKIGALILVAGMITKAVIERGKK